MELVWKIVSAIILALVEGVTEFLPVSSTGHMILVRELLDLDVPPGGVFEVFIQFGAILSICVIYFEYLWKVTKAIPRGDSRWGCFLHLFPQQSWACCYRTTSPNTCSRNMWLPYL
jgi:undecaprenyl pyrophosphate phosphatase UppP